MAFMLKARASGVARTTQTNIRNCADVAEQGRGEGSVNDTIPDRGEVGRRTT